MSKWRGEPGSTRHRLTWVAGFTVLCVVVGATWGWLSEGALGAERTGPTTSRCVAADGSAGACPAPARRAAARFRDGRIRKADGMPVRRMFKRPAVAREVWVDKIERKIRQRRAAGRPLPHADRRPDRATRPATCDRCLAYEYYARLVREASCTGAGDPYPAGRRSCTYPPGTRPFTKKEIQAGGAVVFCGGAVILGVAGSPFSAGATAGIAFFGAAACGWNAWAQMDPG